MTPWPILTILLSFIFCLSFFHLILLYLILTSLLRLCSLPPFFVSFLPLLPFPNRPDITVMVDWA